jgi:glycosyltransferase involved in cell wall biosynthesis
MLKLSIITINYNNLLGLKKTVESIVNQSWKEFEYIIIDGGSNDGSANYISSISKHLSYWVSELDEGIYDAMNKGIHAANGEYLLFMNSGDRLVDNGILALIEHKLQGIDFYYGNTIYDYNGGNVKLIEINEEIGGDFIFTRKIVNHQSSFIKRELLINTPYNLNYKLLSDWVFYNNAVHFYGATYQHLQLITTIYDCSGISSKPETQILIKSEMDYYFIENHEYFFKLLIDINKSYKSQMFKLQNSSFFTRLVFELYKIKKKYYLFNIN